MEVAINWVGVGIATLMSFVVGFIWYMPGIFGETWRKLVGLSKADMKKGPGGQAWALTMVSAFLQAYVLAHVTYLSFTFFDMSWLMSALTTAVWLWLGFQVSLVLVHDSFEQRRLKLSALTIGNQLVTLLAMAVAIGLFKP